MSSILQIKYKRPLAWPPTLIVHALGERASRHAGGAHGNAQGFLNASTRCSCRFQTTRIRQTVVLAGLPSEV